MKPKTTLKARLTSYSALMAAAISMSKGGSAQILYTDVEPDTLTEAGGIYVLDLNNDGSADFKFNMLQTFSGDGYQARVIGYGNNLILRDLDDWPGSWQQYQYAAALQSGSLIDAADSFKHQEILGTFYMNGNDFGDWVGVDGLYLGLKLVSGGNSYYGWARLSLNATWSELTAIDYALDTVADEGIIAGDKCGNYASIITTLVEPSGTAVFCEGSNITLTTDTVGGFTYQWLLNNEIIAGAEGSSYAAGMQGGYRVVVSNSYGCADTSDLVQVTQVPLPAVPQITQDGSTLHSTSADSYQWYLNGALIPGATSQSYEPQQGGDYTVLITDANGCSSLSEPFTFIPVGMAESGRFIVSIIISDNIVTVHAGQNALRGGSLSLINAAGIEVYSFVAEDDNIVLDLRHLERGLYILRVSNGDSAITRKVIIL
jgi:hypothetical protein